MFNFTTPNEQKPPLTDWEAAPNSNHFSNNRIIVIPIKIDDADCFMEIAVGSTDPLRVSDLAAFDYAVVKRPDNSLALAVRARMSMELDIQALGQLYGPTGLPIGDVISVFSTYFNFPIGDWYTTSNSIVAANKNAEVVDTITQNSYIDSDLKPLTVLAEDEVFYETYIYQPILAKGLTLDSVVYWNGELIENYEYGDTSGPGGGYGGSFDNSSDSVDFSSLPIGGAAASGLISMFAPTGSQLASFGQFLWATLFDGSFDSLLTSLKKWVNDPIESVIQLSAYPVTPPAGSATTLKFCGIRSDLVGSGVVMNKCTSQFMDFDFGQLQTPAYWKQALDYSPYTKVSIYLPYIGICPLASDDVIDATLHLKYHIDLLTGGFSAELKVSKNIAGTQLSSVMYNWSGNMATQIPITSSNFSQVFGSMMTAVAAIGVGAVTGGMGAAAAGGGAEAAGSAAVAGGALSGAGHGLAANIGNVINSKPHVTQSGRLDGTVGALSQFTPYLIIERPVQSLSSLFQKEQGYPSNVAQRLGDLSGLTVCEAPIMNGFNGATEEEIEEIRSYLVGGVIL